MQVRSRPVVVLTTLALLLLAASCQLPTPVPAPQGPATPTGSTQSATPGGSSTPGAEPERFTPLIIRTLGPDPIPVPASDGKLHVIYELEVLNAAPRPATISTVETLADGPDSRVVATLRDDQVVALSILVGDYALPPVPAKVVPPGRTLLLVLEATFDDRAAVPASLTHRLTATYGAFEPNQGDLATNNFPARSVEVGGVVQVGQGEPERIGPPLSGDSWVAVNGCCELSPHRGAMLPVGGRINGSERYAVDWSTIDLAAKPIVDFTTGSQATFTGDPARNESYFTFGQPVSAVGDGTVVTVVNDLAEAPPHKFLTLPLGDLGGNRVVLKHRDGVYSFYAHLKTGSITVKAGDVVKRGQQLAEAGNSGNTSEAHLHFHLMDGPEPLTATNLPWVLDSFTFQGDVTPEQLLPADAGPRSGQLPLMYSAITLPKE